MFTIQLNICQNPPLLIKDCFKRVGGVVGQPPFNFPFSFDKHFYLSSIKFNHFENLMSHQFDVDITIQDQPRDYVLLSSCHDYNEFDFFLYILTLSS